MPNAIGPHLEQRIVAFALGHPGLGPRRIAAELARDKWGGLRISEHGVWRVLRRVGLNTRSKRLALVARHRDPYERRPELPEPEPVPDRLQRRPRPHRAPDEGKGARGYRLRRSQDEARQMSANCGYISRLGRPRQAEPAELTRRGSRAAGSPRNPAPAP
jgi:hypothetical protein